MWMLKDDAILWAIFYVNISARRLKCSQYQQIFYGSPTPILLDAYTSTVDYSKKDVILGSSDLRCFSLTTSICHGRLKYMGGVHGILAPTESWYQTPSQKCIIYLNTIKDSKPETLKVNPSKPHYYLPI